MRYFVTGGSGFIGSNFVDYVLEDKENSVINYSRHTYAMNPLILEHLKDEERYSFVTGDVTNGIFLLKTLQKTEADAIVHFAASTHVDRSFIYPEEFFEIIVKGTFTLLEAVRSLEKKPKLLYISTDEVFGDVPKRFCQEEDQLAPRNPYSVAKACAELYMNTYFHCYKLPNLIIRLMNNFGPRQHPEKLVAKMITRCLTNTPFNLYQGGSIRGWTYVKDACRAIDKVLREGNIGETYHAPPNTYKTVPEMAEIVLNLMNKKELFLGYKDTRLKDDERYALDGSKMLYGLNFKHSFTFEEGLQQTIEWFKQNDWFWRGVYSP